MNFAERLKEERKRLRYTQSELAKITDVTPKSIGVYEDGKVSPSCSFLEKLDHYGFDLSYILTGKKTTENSFLQGKEEDVVIIPLVEACLSAGGGSFMTSSEVEQYFYFSRQFIGKMGNPKNMVVMRVSGESMEPEVCNDDIVLIDQSKTTILASKIYAVAFGECIYLKRIERLPNQIVLKSSNPNYLPIIIDINEQTEDQFKIIGQALWYGHKF